MSRVKNLSKFLGIYVAFLLQSLLFENLKMFSCSPDIMLALVIVFSVSLDFVPAAVLGAFAGLLVDVMYASVFGINLLAYMFLALLVSLATDRKIANSPLIMSWVSFVSVAAMEIVSTALKYVIVEPQKMSLLFANIFVKGLLAAIFALSFVLAVQYIEKRKQNKNKSKETTEEAVE